MIKLLLRQLESEILRESLYIAIHSFIELFGFHPIKLGEITIDHYLQTSKGKDFAWYPLIVYGDNITHSVPPLKRIIFYR
jgi:hypothetical protein